MAKQSEEKSTKGNFYVDNKKFQELMVKYKETGVISDEICRNIISIAENLTYHRYFIKCPPILKEEMTGNAIENCIRYMHNYDHVKYSNPFAYFTQFCYYAFQRTKTRSKKQLEGFEKYKINVDIEMQGTTQSNDKFIFQQSVVDSFWNAPETTQDMDEIVDHIQN